MHRAMRTLLFSLIISSLSVIPSSAQTCGNYNSFSNNAQYSSCVDLSVLSSFLHWNYHNSTGNVDIAFRHTGTSSSRWASWAINPNGARMMGSQCLVAYQHSNGSMRAYTSPITAPVPQLEEGTLRFGVSNLSATLVGSEITIFATLELGSNMTTVTQVWQEGPLSGGSPASHTLSGANIQSVGTVDFLSGATGGAGNANSRIKRRNVHGVLNVVSWGVLMPLGAMMARYLKVFHSANPAWFYLHVGCQTSAYAVGVAGWATGIKLGSDSPGLQYDTHRNIGIMLFCIGTLQVFALLLRPKPDHKYRLYWNIYHHAVGYAVIILSIFNIFEGFDILDPAKKWRKIYIGILIFLGVNAALMEAITWFIVIRRRKANSVKHSHSMNGQNGENGVNGYGARAQQEA